MSKNFALPFSQLGFGGANVELATQVFLTDDGVNGQLVWSMNDAGTATLLATIDPGPGDTGSAFDPDPIGQITSNSETVVSSALYTVYDAALGQQLWTTDGTAGGTNLVLTLDAGPGTKNAAFAFSQPDNAVFATDDGVHGQKIWFTDGTSAGTTLLVTVDTGTEAAGSEFDPAGIGFSVTSGLFTAPYLFVLYDQTLGQELWSSDGTVSGTKLVTTLETGPGTKSIASFSTTIIDGSGPSATWHDVFVADDGLHGQQIWSTDGTNTGTALLATVDPGTEPLDAALDPKSLDPSLAGPSFASGAAAFILYDKTLGQQLWVSDGTTANLVLTLNAGTGIKNDATLSFPVDGHSVFATDDGVHGQQIWASDGTTPGTTLLATADSGTESAGSEFVPSAVGFTAGGAGLVVLYDQTQGQQLWSTDGTVGGTQLVCDLEGAPGIKSFATQGSALTSGTVHTVVFAIDDGVHGQQIWRTDGTALGTQMLADVPSVASPTGADQDPVLLGNGTQAGAQDLSRAFFSLEDGQELWSTDGTATGTAMEAALMCFLAGTLIATPRGDTPVQLLAPGDHVRTLGGQARRIVWIGRGRVLSTRGRHSAATPVILRKAALADNVPHRDLRVTKAHGFLLDGVLIPVEYLVNHRSIVWDDHAQEVALYHIELETHDILLANGAPAESYRDDGNRWLFQNANSGWHLPPQEPCAPVVTGGPVVDAAWRRLLERSGPRPGLPLTEDPDLHLLVDGQRLEAVSHTANALVFPLPPQARNVRIVSRSAVPAEIGIARDARQLGVALRQIVLRRDTRFHAIDIAAPELADGFHEFEAHEGIRWTAGDAMLPMSAIGALPGATELVLHIGGRTVYVDHGVRRRAA